MGNLYCTRSYKWRNYRVNENKVLLINYVYSWFLWTVRCESKISLAKGHKVLACIYSKGWLGNGMMRRPQWFLTQKGDWTSSELKYPIAPRFRGSNKVVLNFDESL